jgi:hypothetical protein
MSKGQKARHRLRMRIVDRNIERVGLALKSNGMTCNMLERLKRELPKESEMPAKDKYWVFNKTSKGYRKSAHRQPKWTKITNRVPPKGY